MELEGDNSARITNEETTLIHKLRENIQHELPMSVTSLSTEDQDLFLVRWLRARDLDLQKSEKMLSASLKWRIERKADQALDFNINPFFAENFPFGVGGPDKLGQPVILFPMGDWDFRKIISNPDRLAEFDEFVTHFFETNMSHIKKEHNKRKENGEGPITQMTMLIEVKNFAYMQLISLSAIKKLLQIAAIYEAHYPEILHRAFFISCPSSFEFFINMLKPILAAKTMGKLTCYSQMSEWQKKLKELMDPALIPEQYGGSKKI